MGDTNYFLGTVKILENPVQKLVKEKTVMTTIQVEIPQMRQNKFISLVFWGNLAIKMKNLYQAQDYLVVEGYISINKTKAKLKKIIITVLKVYPLLLTSNSRVKKN